jgi:hypothetical protein
MAVGLGGKKVIARHYGPRHIGGSALERFGTLWVIGDEVLEPDFDKVIPGHRPVSGRAGLSKFRSKFEITRSRIGGMARGGGTTDQVATFGRWYSMIAERKQ